MTKADLCDVVVVGAGMVGSACALYAARAGLAVTVVDRGPVAGGTTGAGEGNLLLSDKQPGPELELALRSARLWEELAAEETASGALGGLIEYEAKGGLVVAADERRLAALTELAATQAATGVLARIVAHDELPSLEPHLSRDQVGGAYYPQDAQVQPALAAAHLLRQARAAGAEVRLGETVTGIDTPASGTDGGGARVTGVRTQRGRIATRAVVNAAGTWGGEVAALAGVPLPVLPRRGFVLVTAPLPPLVRHKVYAADYVADVVSDSAALQTSAVVEGTPSGPVLIGASRERVGYDRTLSVPVLRRLAAQAIALFPRLATVPAIRAYRGFRPYMPDHLPVIGEDPRLPGLFHACGHEGAGIGLGPVTGLLIAQVLTGARPDLDLAPFRADRFATDSGGTPAREGIGY